MTKKREELLEQTVRWLPYSAERAKMLRDGDLTIHLVPVKPKQKLKWEVGDVYGVKEPIRITGVYQHAEGTAKTWIYKADNLSMDIVWMGADKMPIEAARTFLKVTDKTIQPLQELTARQIAAFGFTPAEFPTAWNSLIRGNDLNNYKYDDAPDVMVLTIEAVKA